MTLLPEMNERRKGKELLRLENRPVVACRNCVKLTQNRLPYLLTLSLLVQWLWSCDAMPILPLENSKEQSSDTNIIGSNLHEKMVRFST